MESAQAVEAARAGSARRRSADLSFQTWFSTGRFALLLALMLAATFPGLLAGTQSLFHRDYGVLGYPTIFYLRESLWGGELPLWNPYSHCGAPFLAQWGTMSLYPLSAIFLFPLPWSLSVFCIAHLFLGGLGMYWLARKWTGNPFAAAVAGTAYTFNGVIFASLAWPNYTVALGWMPWVVFAAQNAWRQGGRSLCVAALVGAMQMLAGVPEVVLLTWLLIGCLWFIESGWQWRSVLLGRARRPPSLDFNDPCAGTARREPRPTRSALRLASVAALVATLTAAQLLPFFELLAHSHRDTGFGTASWSMAPWGWANLLVPLFHSVKSPQGVFYQPGHVFLLSHYLGIAMLVLAGLSLFVRRERRVWLMAAAAFFGLTMSLGDAGYLYPALKRIFPALGFARYPIKCVYITLFAAPLLAAAAVEWLCRARESEERRRIMMGGLIAIVVIAALVIWSRVGPYPGELWTVTAANAAMRVAFLGIALASLMFVRRQPLVFGMIFLLSIWLDAETHTPKPHPTIASSHFAPGLILMKNPPRVGLGRALVSDFAEEQMYRNRVADFGHDFIGKRLGLWCNLNLLEKIPKVEGASTLLVREQARIQNLFYRNPNTEHPAIADFLGVTHVTASNEVTEWSFRTNAMRWITGGQKPMFAEPTNMVAALLSPGFDPRRVIYVENRVGMSNAAEVLIENETVTAHRITFEAKASNACVVCIAQTFYPAWRAYVDGRRVTLLRANYAFQAIEVPAGQHRVELKYVDRWFHCGAAISIASLALCALVLRKRAIRWGQTSGFWFS